MSHMSSGVTPNTGLRRLPALASTPNSHDVLESDANQTARNAADECTVVSYQPCCMVIPGVIAEPVGASNFERAVQFRIEWVSDSEAAAREHLADHTTGGVIRFPPDRDDADDTVLLGAQAASAPAGSGEAAWNNDGRGPGRHPPAGGRFR